MAYALGGIRDDSPAGSHALERVATASYLSSVARAPDDYLLSDWRYLTRKVPHNDQKTTESCVVQAINWSFDLADRAAGLTPTLWSVPWGFVMGWWNRHPNTPVDPGGRLIRDVLQAYAIHGLVPDEAFPFDPDRILDWPPFNVDAEADDHRIRVDSWERIEGDPMPIVEQDLAGGEFPICRLTVHENFMAYKAGQPLPEGFIEIEGVAVYDRPVGAYKGEHVMVSQGRGPGYALLRNSWGVDYGDAGYVAVSDAAMRDPNRTGEHTRILRRRA